MTPLSNFFDDFKHLLLFSFSRLIVWMKQFVVFLFLYLAAAQLATAQKSVFPVGEKLTYNVSFATFADAGFLELSAEKLSKQPVYLIRTRFRTNGAVQATLLDVDDSYATFINPETLLPARVERALRRNAKLAENAGNFTENQTVSGANVYDLPSAIYHLRSALDFNIGASDTIRVKENDRVYTAKMTVTNRENIATAIGAFNAFVVEVRTDDKATDRWRAKIYFSDDARHLPVLLRIKHERGLISAEIAGVQIAQPVVKTEPPPTPQNTPKPNARPTPRPLPTVKPYIPNQPLDASLPFALGEKLRFEVLRANQSIGTITLKVGERQRFNNVDSVNLKATAENSATARIFAATDQIESFVHPDFLVPFRSQVKLGDSLAGYNQTLVFNQNNGSVTTDKGAQVPIPNGTYDVLSFVYALRAFRYDTGRNPQDTRAAVFIGDAPVIVSLKPTREILTLGDKKIKAISITAATGNPQIDSLNPRLWLSDDARRLPLRLTFNSPLGAITANLLIVKSGE